MATTRRYRATDKSKTAKSKKKVSKRAALIKKVEKAGKVKLRTDWLALYKKKSAKKKPRSAPMPRMGRTPREGQEEALQSLGKRRKWIKRQRASLPIVK